MALLSYPIMGNLGAGALESQCRVIATVSDWRPTVEPAELTEMLRRSQEL